MAADPPANAIALVAPTGAGKTRLLLELRQQLDFDVISADSVQAICHFDIGSAKPTPQEQAVLCHHLIDVAPATERYDAWQFAEAARRLIVDHPEKTYIITAGTGLYLQALTDGLHDLPRLPEPLRTEQHQAVQDDPSGHHRELLAIDPETAAKLPVADWRRIARALEVWEVTGQTMSALRETEPRSGGLDVEMYGIWAEGDTYEATLRTRVARMLESGWIDEVRNLRQRFGDDLPMLDAVGYRQITDMLDQALPESELSSQVMLATRRYAKRQRTWFRHKPVQWFDFHPAGQYALLIQTLLTRLRR